MILYARSYQSNLSNYAKINNFLLEILPFLCFTQPNIVRNPALLVFYATQHRPKSCPSCLLHPPKKVPAKKHKKGKQKVGSKNRSKIAVFRLRILPFLCFTQIGTAQTPQMPRRAGFFGCIFWIYVGFGDILEHYFFVF